MDQKFTCECCNFTTSNKSKYNRHLQTKKHEKYSANIALFSNDIAFFSPNIAFSEKRTTPKKMYECKYCQKVLQHQSSLSRHIKYTCKDNKDEDLKELARLFNEKEKKMNAKDNELAQMIKDKAT